MQPHAAERRHLERQITYARPIFMVLALGVLLEEPPQARGAACGCFCAGVPGRRAGASAGGICSPPERMAASAAGRSGGALCFPSADELRRRVLVCLPVRGPGGGHSLGPGALDPARGRESRWRCCFGPRFKGGFGWIEVFSWVALVAGTFTGGVGLSFMGYRTRLHSTEHDFLARLTALLHAEKGVAESLRLLLGELARGFDCERGIFAFRDAELERIFVWTAVPGDSQAADAGESAAVERRRFPLRLSRKPAFAGTR